MGTRTSSVACPTPALIGAGITGLCASSAVNAEQRAAADRVLSAVGSTLWIEDENQMDGVTCRLRQRPSLRFLFIEALQQSCRRPRLYTRARSSVGGETVQSAAALAAQSSEPAATLRERVTSKG